MSSKAKNILNYLEDLGLYDTLQVKDKNNLLFDWNDSMYDY